MGSLLEMLIVLVGAALLTAQGITEDIAAKRQNLLQLEGQNMASINAALGSYITNNFGTLVPAGYSQTTATPIAAPTLAQLSAQSNNKIVGAVPMGAHGIRPRMAQIFRTLSVQPGQSAAIR
jgi:hypothetical protein